MKSLTVAMLFLVASVSAAGATDFKFLSADDAAKLVAPPLTDGLKIATPYKTDASREEIVMREASGVPEVHEHWNDLMVILDGEASLHVGGTLTGAAKQAGGEWRGGTIEGGTTIHLARDAMVIVPAGMPHHMILAPGAHLKYVVFGTRE